MYNLSKLLPLLILPSTIALLIILIGLWRKKLTFVWVGFFLQLLFSMKIVSDYLISSVEGGEVAIIDKFESKKINADAIVVLSTGLRGGFDGALEWGDPNPYQAGLKLLKKHNSERIVFTNGMIQGFKIEHKEGDFYRKAAIESGIDPQKIYLTNPVLNTYQEASELQRLSKENSGKIKKIILVTSAFHMTRASEIFQMLGFEVIKFPVSSKRNYVSWQPTDLIPSPENLVLSNLAAREYLGRAYYTFIFNRIAK